jgi:energy-coupling factor transport system permease protein
MGIALGLFVLTFISTRISIIRVIKGLKPVLFLLIFTVFLQLIYTEGSLETIAYSFEMQIGLFNLLIMIGIFVFYLLTKKLRLCQKLHQE